MTSPATMRLMGLLVIVGMVAGCGEDEKPSSHPAAPMMLDLTALPLTRVAWEEHLEQWAGGQVCVTGCPEPVGPIRGPVTSFLLVPCESVIWGAEVPRVPNLSYSRQLGVRLGTSTPTGPPRAPIAFDRDLDL